MHVTRCYFIFGPGVDCLQARGDFLMMPRFKTRICVFLAVLLMTWPLLQYAMVQTYHMNAWRFFGWVMYGVPSPVIRLNAYGDDGVPINLGESSFKSLADKFSSKRMHYGDLWVPHELSAVILNEKPQTKTLVIEVATVFLEAKTGSIKERKQQYAFQR